MLTVGKALGIDGIGERLSYVGVVEWEKKEVLGKW